MKGVQLDDRRRRRCARSAARADCAKNLIGPLAGSNGGANSPFISPTLSDEGVYVREQSVDCHAERSVCRNDMGCVHDVIYGQGLEWRPISGAGGA
jgi:hypothetical protein